MEAETKEWYGFCGGFLRHMTVGIAWQLGSVFPSLFSRVQDRRKRGSGRFYWWLRRYSCALLSNLKKLEASVVVRPVNVVLFLSG